MWGRGLKSGANEPFSSFLNRINKFSFCFPIVVLCTCYSISSQSHLLDCKLIKNENCINSVQ